MSSKANIRAYGPSDFEALVGLIGDAFGGESPDSVRFAVSAANTATFVAELDGAVVGVWRWRSRSARPPGSATWSSPPITGAAAWV